MINLLAYVHLIVVFTINSVVGDIKWNGKNWAMACDFRGNDFSNVKSTAEHCNLKCAQTSECTHFAWNKWNGGTCWMKYGPVSKTDAFVTLDRSMVCGLISKPTPPTTKKPTDDKLKLVWEDNFDYNGTLDTNKWRFEIGNKNGWGNNEKQYYTDKVKNARTELFENSSNGRLIIETHRENMGSQQYTSARLVSKAHWTYGRLQIRAKLPTGRGLWPALWMLPEKTTYSNIYWPDNGEIDLMEQVGYDPLNIVSSIHTKAYNHIKKTHKSKSTIVRDAISTFKIYTLEWNENKIETFVGDDANSFATHILTFDREDDWTKWPFNKPFFIVINIAVGGNWGGARGIDNSIFPRRMEIDWVHYYQRH